MNIAVIGAGVSGITAAERLAENHQVTLFEKESKVGGHADTQHIEVDGKLLAVDTGFIVFNPENYPTFFELLRKYKVPYKDSDMSFSVSNQLNGLEYNATSIRQLFCQKSNLFKLSFYRMIFDIFRFYREAPSLLNDDLEISLGAYLKKNKYSENFVTNHIIPMTCALWSGDAARIMDFPARYLVAFMNNHKMLQVSNRPIWKTIEGGSEKYLSAILENAKFEVEAGIDIKSIERSEQSVSVKFDDKIAYFDKIIFACHSDQALNLLEEPSDEERSVLGSIQYQENEILLHSDENALPKNKSAWASWNVLIDKKTTELCRVSYYMNLLQSLDVKTPIIVSLNMADKIDPKKVWKKINYHHPIYNKKTIAAQQKKGLIQGKKNAYYCGAYWGWGFHEDGALSGKQAAQQLLKDSTND